MKKRKRSKPESEKPAITINIQSWATPIVGILMLVVGAFGGYNIRSQDTVALEPIPAPQVNAPAPTENQSVSDAEKMEYLVSQIRHVKGDADAPVTLVEFGDFK